MISPDPTLAIVQPVADEYTARHGVSLFIKREDLIHPAISGNKWRKLKHNILQAVESGHTKVLTFGGAYSNHICATAAAANLAGLGAIGVIRGEKTAPLNHTLSFAESQGMRLEFVSREEYRQKDSEETLELLTEKYGDFYLIPEGGTNDLAVKGTAEILDGLPHFDLIACPVGTGGTLAGLAVAAPDSSRVIGFSALKGEDRLSTVVRGLIEDSGATSANWHIDFSHHEGGYAKLSGELVEFMNWFWQQHGIPLDPIYTGKMMLGIYREMRLGKLDGQRILVVHTGGLQGAWGMREQMMRLGMDAVYFDALPKL